MGGMLEVVPTAMMTFLAVTSVTASSFVTSTRPGPAMCASPRMTVAPAASRPARWLESSGHGIPSRLIIQSRRSDA